MSRNRMSLFAFIRDWIEAMLIFLVFELADLMPGRKPLSRRSSTPPRPGWEKTGDHLGETGRKHPGTVGNSGKHQSEEETEGEEPPSARRAPPSPTSAKPSSPSTSSP